MGPGKHSNGRRRRRPAGAGVLGRGPLRDALGCLSRGWIWSDAGGETFPIEPGFVERWWGRRAGKLGSGVEAQEGTGHWGEGCGRAAGVGVEMNPPGGPRSPLVRKSSAREGERIAARAPSGHAALWGTGPQELSLASFRTSPYKGLGVSLVYTEEPEVSGSPRVWDPEEHPTSSEDHEANQLGKCLRLKEGPSYYHN